MTRQSWTIIMLFGVGVLVMVSCMSVNPESVRMMSDKQLCELLGPAWITTPSENEALHNEINRRGIQC